jgi:5-hydroxyisourate hydrolase
VGRLTTHVLDTAHGCPAAGVAVALYHEHESAPLCATVTNSGGRCDAPLLEGMSMAAGRYRLIFEAGGYFRAKGLVLPNPAFLETVRIDFGIADIDAHYHVPLLLSPYGYCTYRGS